MKHIRSYYEINEEVKDFDYGFDLTNAIENANENDIEKAYWDGLGKSGELLRYMNKRHYDFTFGILKSLFKDAISFKKKREIFKGVVKFAIRITPVALGPIALPVMIIGKIFGISRAFNKIIVPILNNMKTDTPYQIFLKNIITFTFGIMEGDVKNFIGRDWYYNIFYMDKGLIDLVKKEHLFEFANYLSEKMTKESDEKIVPYHYVENEFRKWINEKFKIYPKLPTERKRKGEIESLLSRRN